MVSSTRRGVRPVRELSVGRQPLARIVFGQVLAVLSEALLLLLFITILWFVLMVVYVGGFPPVLPVLAEGVWFKGILSLGYLAWCLFGMSFTLQAFTDPANRHPKFRGLRVTALVLVSLGIVVAYPLGVPPMLVFGLLPFQVAVFFMKDYAAMGRHGILPVANVVLLILSIWILAFGDISPEFQQLFSTWF